MNHETDICMPAAVGHCKHIHSMHGYHRDGFASMEGYEGLELDKEGLSSSGAVRRETTFDSSEQYGVNSWP